MSKLRLFVALVALSSLNLPGVAQASPPASSLDQSSPLSLPFQQVNGSDRQRTAAGELAVSSTPTRAEVDAAERLIVRFVDTSSADTRRAFRSRAGVASVFTSELVPGLEIWTMPNVSSRPATSTSEILNTTLLMSVETDRRYSLTATTNDPKLSSQWSHAAMGNDKAWDRNTGSKSVAVAVLDTGINIQHEDLAANIWTNQSEASGTAGIDDDGNGFIDDVHGWDFIDDDNDPSDVYGHGTHVAGIIGASGNNGLGVSGVNWSVSLVPLKICSDAGGCYLSAVIRALEYSVKMGIRISNNSYGGVYSPSQSEIAALSAAGAAGHLFVAAAGNNASNNDAVPFYPASYDLPNVISVAATGSDGRLAGFSNYGASSVHIAAPGLSIYSTGVNGDYVDMSGTSMASPQVAGVAALVASAWKSINFTWTVSDMRQRLLRSARGSTEFAGKVLVNGSVDSDLASNVAVQLGPVVAVRILGTGSGTVSATGLSCAVAGCLFRPNLALGRTLLLSATPGPDSTFIGWRRTCENSTAPCSLTLSGVQSLDAVFRGINTSVVQPDVVLGSEDALPEYTAWGEEVTARVSGDGKTRVSSHFWSPGYWCMYLSSETGGIRVEKLIDGVWTLDKAFSAPEALIPGVDSSRWFNCRSYGSRSSLSADGNTLVVDVGADFFPLPNRPDSLCGAFVYQRIAGVWGNPTFIHPASYDDCMQVTPVEGGYLLRANWHNVQVSADGRRIVASGPERLWSFEKQDGTWSLVQTVELIGSGDASDQLHFTSLALSGDGNTVAIGYPDTNKSDYWDFQGRVQVLKWNQSNGWVSNETLVPGDSGLLHLGLQLALDETGKTLLVSFGRTKTSVTDGTNWVGGAAVYELGESWSRARVITNPRTNPAGSFRPMLCPLISSTGARVLCADTGKLGNNEAQGWFMMVDRTGANWKDMSPTQVIGFHADGQPFDSPWLTSGTQDLSEAYASLSRYSLLNRSHGSKAVGLNISLGTPKSPAPAPVFSSVVPTSDGFKFSITNFDSRFNYDITSDDGLVTRGALVQTVLPITISGLSEGQKTRVRVMVSGTGFTSAARDFSASAMSKVQVTTEGPTSLVGGLSVTVTNFDPAIRYVVTTSAGRVTVGRAAASILPITVSGLTPGQLATVTISASRLGFTSSTTTIAGSAFSVLPEITNSVVTSAPGRASFIITNNSSALTYTATTTAGRVVLGNASGSNRPVLVSGLLPGQSATVRLSASASRTSYSPVTTEVQVVSLSELPTTVLSQPTGNSRGFTFTITNFDSSLTYTITSMLGRVTVGRASGTTLPVSVSGLTPGQSAKVTVVVSLRLSSYQSKTSELTGTAN